jgi:Gpi18-like mannosyltransferase
MTFFKQLFRPEKTWIKVLIVFIVCRAFLSALVLYAPLKVHELGNQQLNPRIEVSKALSGTIKWDGYYYYKIATEGYGVEKSGLPAFYPLYPYVMKLVSLFLGVRIEIVSFVMNTIFSYFACLFLYLLAKDYLKKKDDSLFALLLFIFAPMNVFLLVFYTEALFCMLTFGAFYFARKRSWLYSCLFLALATATRFPGLIVAFAVFIEYLDSMGWSIKKVGKIDKNIFAFLLAPLGFVAYSFLLNYQFGDPLMMFNAYKYGWSYQKFNLNIASTIIEETHFLVKTLISRPKGWLEAWVNSGIQFFAWIIAVIMTIYGMIKLKLPISYYVFLLVSLLVFVLNSNFVSIARYLLPLFPLYLILTRFLSSPKIKEFRYIVLSLSAMISGVMIVLFTNGFWIE